MGIITDKDNPQPLSVAGTSKDTEANTVSPPVGPTTPDQGKHDSKKRGRSPKRSSHGKHSKKHRRRSPSSSSRSQSSDSSSSSSSEGTNDELAFDNHLKTLDMFKTKEGNGKYLASSQMWQFLSKMRDYPNITLDEIKDSGK